MQRPTVVATLALTGLLIGACSLISLPLPAAPTAAPSAVPVDIASDNTRVPTATVPPTDTPTGLPPTPEPTSTPEPIPFPAAATSPQTCEDGWFFDPDPEGCPADAALRSFATAERFEHGMMVWVESLRQIYVFAGDLAEGATLDVYPDPYRTGMPRTDPSLAPPAGLFQPELGFGAVWRGEGDIPPARESLGWALEEEFGYTTLYQCGAPVSESACFLRGPDSRVIVMAAPQAAIWP
jgi:hypothetical protein